MDHLVVDLALHRLSRAVISALKELEQPHSMPEEKDMCVRFKNLYELGKITKVEYIFLESRILLNEFCYKMEEEIGKGVVCGFLFYSQEHHKLYFGAGAKYPPALKEFLHEKTPTICMETNEHYDRDEMFVVNSKDEWHAQDDKADFKSIFTEYTNVRSGISKRLRLHGVTFGTFECYFPFENGSTEETVELIRKEVQPIKEQLYHFREEMIEALSTMPQELIINKIKRDPLTI